jgi:hypothetical protein
LLARSKERVITGKQGFLFHVGQEPREWELGDPENDSITNFFLI